jgi:hypothetical protein
VQRELEPDSPALRAKPRNRRKSEDAGLREARRPVVGQKANGAFDTGGIITLDSAPPCQ